MVVVGERDLEQGVAQLKEMATGEQSAVRFEDLIDTIKENLS